MTDQVDPREPRDAAAGESQDKARLRLGGMALANGLLVYGPSRWAAAVRTPNGDLVARSGKLTRLHRPADTLPGVRGVVRLTEAFAVLPVIRARMPEARFAFERPAVALAAAAASTAGMLLRRRGGRKTTTDLAVSLLGFVPTLVALRGGNVAAYHGAEHKTIAAYETGGDAAAAGKEHERCGSHLVAPMFLSSIAGDALLRRVLKNYSPAAQAGVALAGVATSVELFAWAERHPDSLAAKLFHAPGFELQRTMGTKEPSADQLAVGQAAIDELLRAEGAAAH